MSLERSTQVNKVPKPNSSLTGGIFQRKCGLSRTGGRTEYKTEATTLQCRETGNEGPQPAHFGTAENRTGMPESIKMPLEQLSGIDLSGVRVHYNSTQPGRLNALAYAQGQDIYVGPGQEKHIPHEGWHVVQQMRGRVNPTMRANEMSVNDDTRLESEADVMGVKAQQKTHTSRNISGASIHIQGNPSVQRTQDVVQLTLQEDVVGDMTIALTELALAYEGNSGVIARQRQAVHDFTDAVEVDDPPSVTQQILIGAINLALGAALGSVGTAIKAFGRRALQPGLLAATRATMGTAVDSAQVRRIMRSSLDSAIDAMVKSGNDSVAEAVTDAFKGSAGTAPTPALKFRAAQEHALMAIGRAQTSQMHVQLAQLRQTEGTEDEWAVINALYAAFQGSLTTAYNEQFSKMTDAWFAMQVTSVGLGARPGVLQIELADRFPDKGAFRITSGNLIGEGANSTVRGRLSSRALKDIGIPKVIRMNGSMGYGILDIMWNISVTGQERQSAGPVIRAPRTGGRAGGFMMTDQHVTEVRGNRWGPAWLAAFHLHLSDLDKDDVRNSRSNQGSGARKVWSDVKGMTPGSIGNSSW